MFPKFGEVGWVAIEYAIVALLMGVAAGYGRMIHDDLHENGVFSAVRYVASGLVLTAFGLALVSISLKPGFPMYLLSVDRGRGSCIVMLCSAVYGYFAQKRDTKLFRQADTKS
jgi:hypothetical protein